MKSIYSVLLLVAGISAGAAQASESLFCRTAENKFGGYTSINLSPKNTETFELSGMVSGGMAHFMREIAPMTVAISFSGDTVKYTNASQGLELDVTTTPVDGRLVETATFRENGSASPESMTCEIKSN